MEKTLSVAFGAFNSEPQANETVMIVRALDPRDKEDCVRLREITSAPHVQALLSVRRLTLCVPKEPVTLAFGFERVLVPLDAPPRQGGEDAQNTRCVPQLGNLGRLSPQQAKSLFRGLVALKGTRSDPIKLLAGEVRQMILTVTASDGPDAAYAVQVEHLVVPDKEGKDKPRKLGELTFVFTQPTDGHDPFPPNAACK